MSRKVTWIVLICVNNILASKGIVILGSKKSVKRVHVDVETILANYVAIRLRHFKLNEALARQRETYSTLFPLKRFIKCALSVEAPPTKRQCRR